MEMELFGMTLSQEQVMDWVMHYGMALVSALLILIIGWMGAKLVRRLAVKMMERAKLEAILSNFIANIIYALVLAVVIIAVLGELGVQTTSLVAVLGAAGLAIGLALKNSLSNFAAGIMIILFKHFKLGDFIESGGQSGTVIDMNVFTTTLQTPCNEKLIVPNSALTEGVLTNYTANTERRIDHVIGVGYSDDLDKVKEAILKVIDAHPLILSTPEPFIGVDSLGDSSVNFVARFWVKKEHFGEVKFTFLGLIKKEFDAQGISIPFPQRDLNLVNAEALLKKAA